MTTTQPRITAAQRRAVQSVGTPEVGGVGINATNQTFRICVDRGWVVQDQRTGVVTRTPAGDAVVSR